MTDDVEAVRKVVEEISRPEIVSRDHCAAYLCEHWKTLAAGRIAAHVQAAVEEKDADIVLMAQERATELGKYERLCTDLRTALAAVQRAPAEPVFPPVRGFAKSTNDVTTQAEPEPQDIKREKLKWNLEYHKLAERLDGAETDLASAREAIQMAMGMMRAHAIDAIGINQRFLDSAAVRAAVREKP